MCGLVGLMSSNFNNKHKECLANLLYLDTWRGRDSTGVAAIRKNADTDIMKQTIPGYEFTEGPKLFEHLKLTDFLWIGHNRFGTMGKNIKTNAHPFTVDDEDGACLVVGAHNGTLKNKHVLTDHVKFGTDSEALYNQISLTGVEDALSKCEGAWALTFYDHVEEEFRVVRNKERPLFYAWSEDKRTLIWASEIWMIKVSCSRADIKLFEDKIYSFAEDTLYMIPCPEKYNDELHINKKEGVVGKKAPTFFQPTGGQANATGATGAAAYQANRDKIKAEQEARQQVLRQLPSSDKPQAGRGAQVFDKETKQWYRLAPGQTLEDLMRQHNSTSQCGTATANSGEKPLPKNEAGSTGPSATVSVNKEGNSSPSGNVVQLNSAKTYKGFLGAPLTLDQLKDDLDAGCSWCELELIYPEDMFGWLDVGKPVCGKCLCGTHDQGEEPKAAVSIH